MINKDDLAIVIVTWNSKREIDKCLKYLKKYPPSINYSTWIVDNASTDGTAKFLAQSYPWVNLIKNSDNEGFSKANNKALKQINSEYVLLLNPDTEVTRGSIDFLLNYLKSNKSVGACGALLLNKDGSQQTAGYYRRLPSLLQVVFFYTNLNKFSIRNRYLLNHFWEEDISITKPNQVDQIPGACLLISYSLIKDLGFLNEKFPIWFEDVDLCYKIQQKGLKLMMIPESKIYHLGGASFEKWSDDKKKEIRFYKSLLTFFLINKSRFEFFLVKIIILLNLCYLISSRILRQRISHRSDRAIFIKNKWEVLKCLLA